MPKRVFIIGIDDSERDVIVDMTLKGSRKQLPRLTHIKLPNIKDVGQEDIRSRRARFTAEMEKALQTKRNFVISGSLVTKTPLGFVPLFEEGALPRMKADVFVLLERDTREFLAVPGFGIVRRKNHEGLEDMRLHQELHRHLAGATGSPIKVLKMERGNVKQSLKEFRSYLLKVMD